MCSGSLNTRANFPEPFFLFFLDPPPFLPPPPLSRSLSTSGLRVLALFCPVHVIEFHRAAPSLLDLACRVVKSLGIFHHRLLMRIYSVGATVSYPPPSPHPPLYLACSLIFNCSFFHETSGSGVPR